MNLTAIFSIETASSVKKKATKTWRFFPEVKKHNINTLYGGKIISGIRPDLPGNLPGKG
jgi:hypothetical protein